MCQHMIWTNWIVITWILVFLIYITIVLCICWQEKNNICMFDCLNHSEATHQIVSMLCSTRAYIRFHTFSRNPQSRTRFVCDFYKPFWSHKTVYFHFRVSFGCTGCASWVLATMKSTSCPRTYRTSRTWSNWMCPEMVRTVGCWLQLHSRNHARVHWTAMSFTCTRPHSQIRNRCRCPFPRGNNAFHVEHRPWRGWFQFSVSMEHMSYRSVAQPVLDCVVIYTSQVAKVLSAHSSAQQWRGGTSPACATHSIRRNNK